MEKVWNDLSEPHLINKKNILITSIYIVITHIYSITTMQLINNQLNTNKINF